MAEDNKDLLVAVENGVKGLRSEFETKFTDSEKNTKALQEKLEGLKNLSTKEEVEQAVKAAKDELQKDFDALAVKVNKPSLNGPAAQKSFSESLGESLDENRDVLSKLKTKAQASGSIQLKVVGDMALTNFGTGAYGAATTEVRSGLYQSPYSPLWLRNILPSASTDGGTIQYLRDNGGEGAAAVWTEGTSKPQVDHDFTLVTETVDWIAGYTKVPRSMLDDVTWLNSYLSQQLVYGKRGLFVAENAEIIATLDANSVAYDGALTAPVERIYEAAFGQLRDNYFAPSYILMNHRDFVTLVALNKASGSGEYDLPQGSVLVINGQMTIGGVPVIAVPNIAPGSFYAIDKNATQFVSRMSPEVRFFDQNEDDAKFNRIMVRAEERIATLVLDSSAIVKGTLEVPAV